MHAQGSWRRNKTVSTYLPRWPHNVCQARRSNSHFKISQVWYPAHFHYAQKPSEHRESAQGASRYFQELTSSGKFSHAFHCVVSYPRNVINKPFRKPWYENRTVEAKPRTEPNRRILNDPHPYPFIPRHMPKNCEEVVSSGLWYLWKISLKSGKIDKILGELWVDFYQHFCFKYFRWII